MNPEEFIEGVHEAVYRSAIDGIMTILARPPGRRPRPALVELSDWYRALDEYGQDQLRELVRLTVDQAVFGLLSGLDGARRLVHAPLSLRCDGVDLTADHDLHELFRYRVDQELGYDLSPQPTRMVIGVRY